MAQITPMLEKLPAAIYRDGLALYAFSSPSSWRTIAAMEAHEKQYIYDDFGLPPAHQDCLSGQEKFNALCVFLQIYEKHNPSNPNSFMPSRFYFTYDNNKHRLAGLSRTFIPRVETDILAVSYKTRPELQNLGYATKAVEMLSLAALEEKVTSCLGAEVEPDNQASARVLLKAGFTEVAQGVCSISNAEKYQGQPMRRFMKTSTISDKWPLNA